MRVAPFTFLLLAGAALGCAEGRGVADGRSKEERFAEAAQPISIPSGIYKYCSAQKGSNWSLIASSANNDPCSTALSALGAGAFIKRAGLWSGTSNNVVVRCGSPLQSRETYQGSSAISDAAAWASGRSHCWFIISPLDLPVFKKPWITAPTIKAYSGLDLLQPGLSPGTCNAYSSPASLDHLAHHVAVPDHTGYDWWDEDAINSSHDSTWNVRAVADGVVWFAGTFTGNEAALSAARPRRTAARACAWS